MALIMIVLTGLPYFYAYLSAPDGYIYNGLNSLTPGDNPVYYSYINQIKSGSLVLKDLFTPENQSVGLFNIFWLGVGIFAKIFNLSPIFAFHLSRLLLIPVFLAVAHLFISLFFSDKFRRKLGLIFLCFSAGIGAYFVVPLYLIDLPKYCSPVDIWVPEAITFLTIYKTPHFIASLGLMLGIFFLMHLSFSKNKVFETVCAGVLALIFFNFHPIYVPTVFLTLGFYLAFLILKYKKILWAKVGLFLLFIFISAPSILYHFWILKNSDVLAQRALQNITPSPPFVYLLFGYGFLWLFAIIGIYFLIKKRKWEDKHFLILSLIIACLFLILTPNQFQSRYTEGLHPALVIFSISGIFAFKEWLNEKNKGLYKLLFNDPMLLVILFFVMFSMSIFFNLVRDLYYFNQKPEVINDFFYFPKGVVSGIEELNKLNENEIIFSDNFSSIFIPVFSTKQVYSAHAIETLDYNARQPIVNWFLTSDCCTESKYDFLKKNNIDYFLFPKYKKESVKFNPDSKDYLKLIYQNEAVAIYEVLK